MLEFIVTGQREEFEEVEVWLNRSIMPRSLGSIALRISHGLVNSIRVG